MSLVERKKHVEKKEGPSNNHEFLFGGLLTESLPDIYGKECAAAIKDRCQRAHQGSHHYSNHQTTESLKKKTKEAHSVIFHQHTSTSLEHSGFFFVKVKEIISLTNWHEFHDQLWVGNI